jgi:Amt family ammonium transporter
LGSLAVGGVAGVVCCLAVGLKYRLGFDDALDVVAVHLVGGVTGALLIGFFGSSAVAGADGLFYGGGWSLLGKQALAVGVVVGYSFVVSLVLAKVIDLTVGLRVSAEEEYDGLDASQHAESGYDFAGLGASTPSTPTGHGEPFPAGTSTAASTAGPPAAGSATAAGSSPRTEVSR